MILNIIIIIIITAFVRSENHNILKIHFIFNMPKLVYYNYYILL